MLPSFVGFPQGVSSGTYDHVFDMTLATSYNPAFITAHGSISDAFNALVAGMETGNAYMNLHSTAFPGGDIRGLLFPSLVPEPGTLARLGLGFAGLGFSRRRQ
jgi:CHRD domain-containing protein/PEP-CTERM motif-containing protein